MSTKPPLSISNSEAASRLFAVGAFCVGLVIFLLVVFVSLPLAELNENRYIAAAFDKRAHLKKLRQDESAQEYLVFGGSMVAFSVSAADIEKNLGTPVYNLGLQASLGLEPLKLYAPFLSPKKHKLVVVVDPLVIGVHADLTLPQCDLVFLEKQLRALALAPKCLPVVLWRQVQDIRYHLRPVDVKGSVYQRSNFNTKGDQVGHLGLPLSAARRPAPALSIAPSVVTSFIEEVASLSSGLEIVVVPPPASDSYCLKNRAQLTDLVARVHAALSTDQTSVPELICIEDALEYDGAWHYGEKGRAQYSQYLTEILATQSE